ncbi:hypothetical protein [Apis mellifera associated microvirus 38]|nr:hypothetical protein [Apis mellifera associated microvirus 38]
MPLIEDRRTWHPSPYRPAASLITPNHNLKAKPHRGLAVPYGVNFGEPKPVICARRAIRKQVLFAKKKTGRGKARRRPRRNMFSSVGC